MFDDQARDEDHAEKILYYIPNDVPLAEQVHTVNVADALIEFTTSFQSDSSIQTAKSNRYT